MSELITFVTFSFVALIVLMPILLRDRKSGTEIQTIATTMGITGTFIGILISLSYFDFDNISVSISLILDGLKTAFWTSVAGISTSLLVNVFPSVYGLSAEAAETPEETDTRLLNAILEQLSQLNRNIVGDDDSTLITQIQKLRTSVNDKQDELKQSFDDFAQEMAKQNTEALIAAVQQVMEDFNAKINDQLGENFKRLSEATENLVTWQDQYREQLATSVEALSHASENLKTTSESVDTFVERAQSFDETATQLKESLDAMNSSMAGLKALSESLEGAGEKIRTEMTEITTGAAEEMQKTMNKTLADFGSSLASIAGKMAEDFERFQKVIEEVSSR